MSERALDTYRRKRDPAQTPEPFGATATRFISEAGGPHRFVVQQHAARRMHWDFRLEIDGVLVSWAVPRGPSLDPKEKRLAVQTEDHPIEYGSFEGIIPAGNYGAGAVILWDRGTYRSVDGVRPGEAFTRGKLDIELSGHKLHGRWALVRTKRSEGKDWLLFKKAEGTTTAPEPVIAQPASIFSGLTIEELKSGVSRTEELAQMAMAAKAAPHALKAASLSPMLAETVEQPFSRSGWIFELKYDGVRALLERKPSGAVRLFSRKRRDITASFPDLAETGTRLPCDTFILDGEIVALDERSIGSFERLQQRLGLTNPTDIARASLEVPALMYCFDLLAVAGYDLRALPLLTRKDLLRRLLPPQGVLRFADHVETDGASLYEAVRERKLEGIVAKRGASLYHTGRRSRDWLKIKAPHTADLVIVGFVPGKGSRRALGALMLAWRDDDGLSYAGNVGSGLDVRTIKLLLKDLEAAKRRTPAFKTPQKELPRGAVFVEPRLLAEVRYTEVTERGALRQPVFLRLRDDKPLSEADPQPAAAPSKADAGTSRQASKAPTRPTAHTARQTAVPGPESRRFSNLDKIFWPGESYTKGDLIAYYEAVWPMLAPYLRDRPVVLTRYPDGIEGKSFFQKNAPEFIPDWVPTCRIEDTEYFLCNHLEALLYVINLGCIPLHVWSARRDTLDRPDWAILDLDPKGAPFSHVITVAKHIHKLLASISVPHFIKTSGQDGLHILVPLNAALNHHEARTLAEVIARVVVAELPEIATVARPLGQRASKVYVDFLQNGFGKTIVAPLSVRPRPGAPVSTPLDWREVSARLDPMRFTIRTVPARFKKRADPMRAVLETRIDVPKVLNALGKRLS